MAGVDVDAGERAEAQCPQGHREHVRMRYLVQGAGVHPDWAERFFGATRCAASCATTTRIAAVLRYGVASHPGFVGEI
ncbi:hypothetical protein ACTMU2_08605 [Cupriavidus basilensis]